MGRIDMTVETVEVSIYATPKTIRDIERLMEEIGFPTPGEAVSCLALFGDKFLEEYMNIKEWYGKWIMHNQSDDGPNAEGDDGFEVRQVRAVLQAFEKSCNDTFNDWEDKQGIHVEINRPVFEFFERKSKQSGSHGGAAMSTRLKAGVALRDKYEECKKSDDLSMRLATLWVKAKIIDPVNEDSDMQECRDGG